MIFCSEECYKASGLALPWEAIVESWHCSPGRLLARIRKIRYRKTPQGKAQRKRESRKRYAKQKEMRQKREEESQSSEIAAISDPGLTLPANEPDDLAVVVVPPTQAISQVVGYKVEEESQSSETAAMSAPGLTLPADEPDDVAVVIVPPAQAISPETELRQAEYQAVLKQLFSAFPGVIPRSCKRPGCEILVIPRSPNVEKRFCSKACMNTLRTTIQNLREALRVTQCPMIRLLRTLLRLL